MKGGHWNNLDVLAIEAQKLLQEEKPHISDPDPFAPKAHVICYTDNKTRFSVIQQGGYLGAIFKPRTMGSRTFQALPAKMSVGEGVGERRWQPPLHGPRIPPSPSQSRGQLPRRTEWTANY